MFHEVDFRAFTPRMNVSAVRDGHGRECYGSPAVRRVAQVGFFCAPTCARGESQNKAMNERTKNERLQARTVILESAVNRDSHEATLVPHTEAVVGRAGGSDIQIGEAMVSRRHCRLTMDRAGGVFVEDLSSHHGTAVNDRRINGISRLRDGDELWIGAHRFTIRFRQRYPFFPRMATRISKGVRTLFTWSLGTDGTAADSPHENPT